MSNILLFYHLAGNTIIVTSEKSWMTMDKEADVSSRFKLLVYD